MRLPCLINASPLVENASPVCSEEVSRQRRGSLALRFFAIDDPWDCESIDQHREMRREESLLQWHPHRAVLCEGFENALRFRPIGEVENHGEALRFLIALRRVIAASQAIVAQHDRRVDDFVTPLGRRLLWHWCVAVFQHEGNLAAETFFVKFKRLFALTLERQMWIQLHLALL